MKFKFKAAVHQLYSIGETKSVLVQLINTDDIQLIMQESIPATTYGRSRNCWITARKNFHQLIMPLVQWSASVSKVLCWSALMRLVRLVEVHGNKPRIETCKQLS